MLFSTILGHLRGRAGDESEAREGGELEAGPRKYTGARARVHHKCRHPAERAVRRSDPNHVPQTTADVVGNKESASGGRFRLGGGISTVPE